jgi:hypothetical protein
MQITEIFNKNTEVSAVIDTCKNVAKNCSQFLNILHKTNIFLYRGIYSDKAIIIKKSPTGRMPTGQTQSAQYILDTILQNNGFTALRSNSICCSSTLANISSFGPPYIIFPHNGFSFTWSNINDIGSNKSLADSLYTIFKKQQHNSISISTNDMKNIINYFKFKNTDLIGALESGNEIAIHGIYTAISRYYIDIVADFFSVEEGS